MKVNIFKKLIRDIIREELDYKLIALEKKLDEVLVSSRSNSIVEDTASQPTATPPRKVPAQAAPLTKDSILNDILSETASSGEWQNIDKETEVKSVVENTQNLPDHLADAFTKDYSGVLKKVNEKAKFRSGA